MKKALALLREFVSRADIVLLVLCCAASVFGIIVISSATASMRGSFVVVQIGACIVGIGLYVLLTIIDIDILADKWILLYIFSAVLILLLRTPLGYEDETGNRAWLRFFNIGIAEARGCLVR